MTDPKLIRNFSIIAHIDHGKSTLADRLLEMTNTIAKRHMQAQVLDSMDIERERGITIKAQAARMDYIADDGQTYVLNLIDTPGHVDFGYEVSRSLAACEGALLIVDATQGVEAQTLANVHLASENNLEIVVVINKIDLPSAEPERIRAEIEDVIGIPADEAILASAKNNIGVKDVLEAIVKFVPAPRNTVNEPLRALIFDSYFDSYRGIIVYFRVKDGEVKLGDKIRFMANDKTFDIAELGVLRPAQVKVDRLGPGEVGYLAAQIKDVETLVGDTITLVSNPAIEALPGYRPAKPMVYAGIYPVDNDQYPDLREALEKLKLNDSSLFFEPETSDALGFGFRCGFLGLLHMEIIQERLEREYNLNLITTAPSVVYRVTKTDNTVVMVENPALLPDPTYRLFIEEPFVTANIITPTEYVGTLMELCQQRRGVYVDMKHLDPRRAMLVYELPLAEIITDFFDQLKSRSRGYASLDYLFKEFREERLVKIDILIGGDKVDALSAIVHYDRAHSAGRAISEKLKKLIPRQMFEVPIQAAIGGKIVARETISAVRKNVLAKCYGGDISRKRKLLDKQKEGKKRMKSVGRVDIPQEAFMALLKIDE
ncbi:MAG: elongation factor 4 [Cyanobacteria bacterium DS3.002]|nr:elongation factor 4 [Cyanobacteria bacterium DS3.002]MBA4049906.1 elongation factor 4 [Cyanobacteria bacterium DS2.008]MBA4074983.1 elongation factor 4 [Cyanobacteria bacterium PR.023]MDQ5935908.1 GTP-binding protein LepA [Cyanobacteriota bacterium erpe_2018_sw_21hr_WHONDRS-SW48-000092_B_bin.40]